MYFVINLIKDCKKKNPNKLMRLQIFETSLPVHEDNEENEVHMQNMLECPQFYRNYVNMYGANLRASFVKMSLISIE